MASLLQKLAARHRALALGAATSPAHMPFFLDHSRLVSSSSSSPSSSSSSSLPPPSTASGVTPPAGFPPSGGASPPSGGASPEAPATSAGDATSAGEGTASFGYRVVPEAQKQQLVGEVFSSVASRYDVMNDLMSAGMHRLWKDRLVQKLRPCPGLHHIDVAGGTGDVAFRILRAIRAAESSPWRQPVSARESDQGSARVLVCDINPQMLEEGRAKARSLGILADPALEFAHGNAEDLSPLLHHPTMDSYSIAFGLRNVTHIEQALQEAYRVLREGGHFLCLEFSHVPNASLRQLYDAYSFAVIPALGRAVANDAESYQYLVESIRRFPRQETLAQMMREAGFQRVSFENMTGGIVALHSGYKL